MWLSFISVRMAGRQLLRWSLWLGSGGAVGAAATAYWYRPFPDYSGNSSGPTRAYNASAASLYEVCEITG